MYKVIASNYLFVGNSRNYYTKQENISGVQLKIEMEETRKRTYYYVAGRIVKISTTKLP